MKGVVKFYDPIRLWGFIIGEDGRDYFVHRRAIEGPALSTAERVEFEPHEGPRGLRAERVRRLA